MEPEDGLEGVAVQDVVLKVAKTLQGSFSKQMTGSPRKWRDVPPDEKTVWMRLSRTAARILAEAPVPGEKTPAPAPAPSVPKAEPSASVVIKGNEKPPVPVEAKPRTPASPAEKSALSRLLGGGARPPANKK